MSYTIPNCMTEFSNEQLSLMRGKLDNAVASVVDRTRSLPSDIIGDLIGPSEVSKGFLVRFSISDKAEGDETFEYGQFTDPDLRDFVTRIGSGGWRGLSGVV